MWNAQLKIFVSIFTLTFLGMAIHSRVGKKQQLISVEEVAIRQPASAAEYKAEIRELDPANTDVYQFDRRMRVVINKKEVLTDIHYSGKLFIDWKEVKKNESKAIFSFQMNDADTSPVFAEVGLSGDFRLLKISTTQAATENDENSILFLKDLISIYAFNTFEDTTGKYTGTMQIGSGKNGEQVFIKRKIRYNEPSLEAMKFNPSIHEVHVEIKLKEASGLEDTRMGNDFKTHGVYTLKLLSADELARNGIKRISLDSRKPLKVTSIKTNPNQMITEGGSWELLEEKLNSMNGLKGKERLSVFHELLKEIKKNPNHLDPLMAWMKSGMNDQKKIATGVGLLASLGTEKAQHELIGLYDQTKNRLPESAHLILNSIASSGNKPTPEVIGMLNSVLDAHKENPELAANAAYALGAAGEVKKIIELAEQATDKNEKIIYIDAMGNGGSNESLGYLLESARSPDPQIREKAIFALRFVNDGRVKGVFEQAMQDAYPGVRYSVVRAVQFQPKPDEYESLLKNCSTQGPGQNLKALCAETLADI